MHFSAKDYDHPIGIMPRFKLKTSLSKSAIIATLIERVNKEPSVNGKTLHDHFYLSIPPSDWHFWSPELNITIEENESHSIIRCLVGPRQTVWTLFLFLYASISLLVLFGGMYGLTQWQMDKPTLWLWIIPIGLILLLGVYVAAKIGQSIGKTQMLHLISFTHHALNADGKLALPK